MQLQCSMVQPLEWPSLFMITAFDHKKPTLLLDVITSFTLSPPYFSVNTSWCFKPDLAECHRIYVWHSQNTSYYFGHNLNLPHCRSNTKFHCLLPCDTHHFRRMGPENAPCPSTHQWTVTTNSPNFSQPGFCSINQCRTGIILFLIAFGYLYWVFWIYILLYPPGINKCLVTILIPVR